MWKKSSYSTVGNCVEVTRGYIGETPTRKVRDSKDPGGPVLVFTEDEWQAFLRGARDGEFD